MRLSHAIPGFKAGSRPRSRNLPQDCQRTLVPVEGIEPPCLAASDPKSGASANFATPARTKIIYREYEQDDNE